MQEGSFKIPELMKQINAEYRGDPECVISGVASLASAQSGQLSYLVDDFHAKYLATTQASVVIVSPNLLSQVPASMNVLVVPNPQLAFIKLAGFFIKPAMSLPVGVHASAQVPASCQLAENISIGAGCVLGEHVRIGANTVIMPGTILGDAVQIGSDCQLFPRVTVLNAVFADRVIVHSGAVIGADGFGNAQHQGQWVKIPQLGLVRIGPDVEIGANTTIDRGALDDTIIAEGVKLDNQIQIGHNVHIGAHTAIAGCTGIAGSTTIGQHCMIAGLVGINGHITITDQVIITGMTQVTKSILEPGIYSSGTGLQKSGDWRRSVVRFRQLDHLTKRVNKLERVCDE